ncbi:hypothetical protein QAD02_021721 [Eretmocerus hayati]|uniref:Uncharacterized protein n=1 Tax=Eretmocerus hayati TaxID=131215 RepID=A0ACC2PR21_9HYME|nr:hypothetical protein QAD02_021721 [Eretmocerus hayati]
MSTTETWNTKDEFMDFRMIHHVRALGYLLLNVENPIQDTNSCIPKTRYTANALLGLQKRKTMFGNCHVYQSFVELPLKSRWLIAWSVEEIRMVLRESPELSIDEFRPPYSQLQLPYPEELRTRAGVSLGPSMQDSMFEHCHVYRIMCERTLRLGRGNSMLKCQNPMRIGRDTGFGSPHTKNL